MHRAVVGSLLVLSLAAAAGAAPVTGGMTCAAALGLDPTLSGLITSDQVGGCTIGAFTYNNFLYSSDAVQQGESPFPTSSSIDTQLLDDPTSFGFRFSSDYVPNTYEVTHRISYTIDPPPPVILGGSLEFFDSFDSFAQAFLAAYFTPQDAAFVKIRLCGGSSFAISDGFICPPIEDSFNHLAEELVLTSDGPFTGQFAFARNVVGVLVEINQGPGESFPDFGVTSDTYVIPEPATMGLVLGGLGLFLLRRRR